MKGKLGKLQSLILSLLVIATMAVTPVMADEAKEAPTEVKSVTVSGFSPEVMNLEFSDTAWMEKINSVTVNDKAYTKGSTGWGASGNNWEVGNATGAYGSYKALKLVNPSKYPATIKIAAEGYKNLTVKVTKNGYSDYTAEILPEEETTYTATVAATEHGSIALSNTEKIKAGDTVTATATPDENYELSAISITGESGKTVDVTKSADAENTYTFAMPAENVTVKGTFTEKAKPATKKINLDQVSMGTDFWGNDWEMSFKDADGYVKAITKVQVNGTAWTEKSYSVSTGGQYRKYNDDNKLTFAAKDFSASPEIPVLKSGDIITISADGYEDLTMKLVIDKDGKATLTKDDGQGDPYELLVKIEGSFEAAIIGQKNYDGVSSASVSGSSTNKNSSVKVFGALVKKGSEPADSDWEELDNASKISLNGSKCKVSIVPDTEKGTAKDSDSGMQGIYMTTSSSLTLNGTPKDAGSYLVSVSIEDNQGRTAVSNVLPFRVYSGEETLADQLKTENFKKYDSGLYAWDIMEPWAIKNFGSNVKGEENSVRVPEKLEAWFGSHESGTYGYLGYDIPWKNVQNGYIPQTLYIPKGCDLTLTNMEILSSVRIVVEDGGKLTLSDSVVQGIIDVQKGGTFSMNYDSFNKKFTTGSSICGQLRLADGAILENAAIYSHANYLANGDLTDRSTTNAVVSANGNVTVKGQVFIKGDADGDGKGQTALKVNGTLNLADDAVLVATGGEGMVNENDGGTAIDMVSGSTIAGSGKLVAIGGKTFWGNGGDAVTGNGTISTSKAYLQGATASKSKNREAGKATNGTITVKTTDRHVKDGQVSEKYGADDELSDLYWKEGIDATPPLDKYVTEKTTEPTDPSEPTKPTDPSNPSDPSNPTEPTDPSQPSNPSKPSDSTDDTKDTGKTPSQTGADKKASENMKKAKKTAASNTPSTGDEANLYFWIILAIAAGGALAGRQIAVRKRK